MLTVAQAAERLALSLSMTYRLIDAGSIPHYRFGRAIRVSEDQLAAYLEKAKRERDPEPAKKRKSRPALHDLEI